MSVACQRLFSKCAKPSRHRRPNSRLVSVYCTHRKSCQSGNAPRAFCDYPRLMPLALIDMTSVAGGLGHSSGIVRPSSSKSQCKPKQRKEGNGNAALPSVLQEFMPSTRHPSANNGAEGESNLVRLLEHPCKAQSMEAAGLWVDAPSTAALCWPHGFHCAAIICTIQSETSLGEPERNVASAEQGGLYSTCGSSPRKA